MASTTFVRIGVAGRSVLLLAGFAFSGAAFAIDGVIEINQVRALRGGITTGDTAGFPVTISAPGSYRLTSNLDLRGEFSPQNVTAINVTGSNVSIDMNGFSIIGPATCTGTGATLACSPSGTGFGITTSGNPDNLTLRDGTIRGMGAGAVYLFGTKGALLSRLHVINNGDGITLAAGSALLDSFVMYNKGVAAVLANGVDITSVILRGNTVVGNFGAGISVNKGSVITGNSIVGNGGHGLDYTPGSGAGNNVLMGNNGGAANPQTSGGSEIGLNVCDHSPNPSTACP